jgi:hypothetical protein
MTIPSRVVGLAVAILLILPTSASAAEPFVLEDDSYRTPVGQTLVVAAPGFLGNDTLPVPGGAFMDSSDFPTHGSLSPNVVSGSLDGAFTYVPNAGFSGVDTFQYGYHDSTTSEEKKATVTIRVEAVDAVDDTYSVNAGQTLTVESPGVVANDTKPVSYLTAVVDSTDHGALDFNNAFGSFTYTPEAGFSGTDTFTYNLYNAQHPSSSDVATVTITVIPPDPVPVADDDLYSTDKGVQLTVNAASGLLANDSDATSVALDSNVDEGILSLSTDGSFVYTPAANPTVTQVTFTYTATGPGGTSSPATVTIRVVPPMAAADDSYSVDQGQTLEVIGGPVQADRLTANDTLDGHPCDCETEVVTEPAHGNLTVTGGGGFTYTPDPSFNGIDTFTYRATDSIPYTVKSNTATVSITVNDVSVPNVFEQGPTASISGTPTVGSTLTAGEGSPSPTPDSYEYQWYADGAPIDGADSKTFTLTDAQVGKVITVQVTAVKADYTDASDTSAPTAAVTGGSEPPKGDLVVPVGDSTVAASCTFSVRRVQGDTVVAKFTTKAKEIKPSYFSPRTVASITMRCTAQPAGLDDSAAFGTSFTANSSVMYRTRYLRGAAASSYELCGELTYRLRNGVTRNVENCSS